MTRTTKHLFGALTAVLLAVGLAALVLMTIAASVGVQEAQAKQDASAVAPKGNKKPEGVGASGVNSIAAFGNNTWGQLGNGNTTNSTKPVAVADLAESEVKAVAAGSRHSAALKRDGTVWTWGRNADGQLGDGTHTDRITPVQVKDPNDPTGYLTGVVAIEAGENHTVALKEEDGTVWGWGANGFGQLGLGEDSDITNTNLPQQAVDLDDVESIAAGLLFTLGLKEDGSLYAWGVNSRGELGDGSQEDRPAPVPVRSENGRILTGVMSIAAGEGMSIAAMNDGTVWSWGTLAGAPFPVQVTNADGSPVSGVRQVSTGGAHALFLNADGTVTAWGVNWDGELGNGTTGGPTFPVKVLNLTGIKAVAAGWNYSLARTTSGRVYAWGGNQSGQLGDGTNTTRLRPVQVPNLTGVMSISASDHNTDNQHSLAQ